MREREVATVIKSQMSCTGFGNDFLDMTSRAQATKEKKKQTKLRKNVTHEKILYGTSLVVKGLRRHCQCRGWGSISG